MHVVEQKQIQGREMRAVQEQEVVWCGVVCVFNASCADAEIWTGLPAL